MFIHSAFLLLSIFGYILWRRQAEIYKVDESSKSEQVKDCLCSGKTDLRSGIDSDSVISDPSSLNLEDKGLIVSQKIVSIPGGVYEIGTDDPWFLEDGEGPARLVNITGFDIDSFEVSNAHFLAFVQSEGYVTEAEIFGWSFVFDLLVTEELKLDIHRAVLGAEWWLPVNGANWIFPEGPGMENFVQSDRINHPVVQVSFNDALAFCSWRGMRLPTEAEWEVASRGGKRNRLYPWGNNLYVKGQHMLNIWQGEFPYENLEEDGYLSTAPIDSYEKNSFGLYNTAGNVWEWVNDWFSSDTAVYQKKHEPLKDPTGPEQGKDRVQKGGSYMCHKSTCYRYRNAARGHASPESAATNVGFRCARTSQLHA